MHNPYVRQKICNLRSQGLTIKGIVNRTGVCITTVRSILHAGGVVIVPKSNLPAFPDPTQEEIALRAAEIRKNWSPVTERARRREIS